MQEVKFSLVVTTVGVSRLPEMSRLFDSLRAQTEQRYETILIHQTANADECRQLQSLGAGIRNLKVIQNKVTSLSAARNVGMRHVRGRIVCFPDDDCWYPPSLLEDVGARFERGKFHGLCTYACDPIRMKPYGKRSEGEVAVIDGANLLRLPISFTIFVDMMCIQEWAIWFDERLGVGAEWECGEETDFIWQLLKRHARVMYDGGISVFHEVREHSATDVAKAYRYGRGWGALARKLWCDGCSKHIVHFVGVGVRSVAGTVASIVRGRVLSSRVYMARVGGMTVGVLSSAEIVGGHSKVQQEGLGGGKKLHANRH